MERAELTENEATTIVVEEGNATRTGDHTSPESEEDGRNWFDENVKPNLPPEIIPDRSYYPLHTAITK